MFPFMIPSAVHRCSQFFHAVVTNVPGTSKQISFCKIDVDSMTPIVCLPNENGVGFALASYQNEIRATIHMKLDPVANECSVYRQNAAQNIANLFCESFNDLLLQVHD
uniref:O-acyltransferase WSD1 C-terminal domain-containing protein n=1 Tax=Spongospora subterranea TaxID=70186 RepID=A0A0H5RFT3_9EUKA|eukprot:CRZ13030.1 hypothetical protein [Spongospora subterranea]